MEKLLRLFVLLICYQSNAQTATDKVKVETVLDNWHKAASEAKFDEYFGLMAKDAVFIGTDPTENWQFKAFQAYAKPHFDKGKAWSFTAIERHIYFSDDHSIAWFDELLDTQMKICRGSGVLKKESGQWKIAHYVLSMTIPNENSEAVIQLKADFDNAIIAKSKSTR